MEEDQELMRHMCRICNKSFPCGRSLGGHMRSHMINSTAEVEGKVHRSKDSCFVLEASENQSGYGLRENPKKASKFEDSKTETPLHEKFCRACGKGFQSWKSLFGHMKCHSDKERNVSDQNLEEDSWISSSSDHKLAVDSQSDNETISPNRKKRSRRRITRYMALAPATSSSLSIANNASCSVSGIEVELEEVAMCLMMLSRDVGHWGDLNFVAESSDNSSMFSDDPSWSPTDQITRIEEKNSACDDDGTPEYNKHLKERKLYSRTLASDESYASGSVRNELKIIKAKNNFKTFVGMKQPRLDYEFEASQVGKSKGLARKAELEQAELVPSKCDSKKRKYQNSHSAEIVTSIQPQKCSKARSKISSKYECTTCNRTFHSYQALGGHRASHRKGKGCIAPRIESSENSIGAEAFPDPEVNSELPKPSKKSFHRDNLRGDTGSHVLKKTRGHECPICFKVFSSGQALGGHKRSHMVASEPRNSHPTTQNKPEKKELLDLNLPAPAEDDNSGSNAGLKPWWVGSSHDQGSLDSLLPN